MARAAVMLWKPRSPKTSLIAHAKTSSAPDGLDGCIRVKDGIVLYEENEFGRVTNEFPDKPGGVTSCHSGSGQRLASFLLLPGNPASPPLPPSAGVPPVRETSQDFGRGVSERVSEAPTRASGPSAAHSPRRGRVKETNSGFQPTRVLTRCRHRRHSSKEDSGFRAIRAASPRGRILSLDTGFAIT